MSMNLQRLTDDRTKQECTHREQTSADPEDPDFGLPDPKRDPDRHQNCITWSLSHALSLQKISSKSIHKFVSNLMNRQTNRQTDRTENITSFFGGGNKVRTQLIQPSPFNWLFYT